MKGKDYRIVSVCAVLVVFFLCGCFKTKSPGTKTNLRFLDLGTLGELKRMPSIIESFEKSHPGVKVSVEYTPGFSQVRQKILTQISGGVDLDIVYLYDTAFPEFIARGVFSPLDEFIKNDKNFQKNDFDHQAIQCATFNGKIYAIPPTFGTFVIFYNKALFQEKGIAYPQDGWSWEEFRETCLRLTTDKDGDGKPEQFGCTGSGFWFWLPMIFQNGGRILDDNGDCVLNSKEVTDTLQFIKDMYIKDKVFPSALSYGGTAGMNESQMFSMGKAAMMHAGIDVIKDLPKDMDWDVVAPPEKKGGEKYFHGGFWGYAITAQSKNKEIAWEFLKFLTSREILKEYIQGTKEGKWQLHGGAPSRISLKDDFLSVWPDKHLESYLYCLQYPEFRLAQSWGDAIINEVAQKYDIQVNLAGITKEDLKVLLNNFTDDVNKALRYRIK